MHVIGTLSWGALPAIRTVQWLATFARRPTTTPLGQSGHETVQFKNYQGSKLALLGNATRVVILGGGFAGLKIKLALDRTPLENVEVVLIDEKSWFEYTPSVLRAIVYGEGLSNISFPYPVEVLCGLVSRIDAKTVVLDDGREVDFDLLVIATGGSYSHAKPPHDATRSIKPSSDERLANLEPVSSTKYLERDAGLHKLHEEIKDARSILIIGGGIVGVELAAEIFERFGHSKAITIIHRGAEICSSLPEKARLYISDYFRRNGVRVVLQANSMELGTKSCRYATATGQVGIASFDISLDCTGIVPNSSMLRQSLPTALDGKGFIRVNDYLQVHLKSGPVVPNVFALGDVCSHRPSQQFGQNVLYADLQCAIVVNNLLAKIRGSSNHPPEKFPRDITGSPHLVPTSMITSLGEIDASFVFEDIVVNGFIAALTKVVIEETKKLELANNPFGTFFWWLSDSTTAFVFREWFARPKRPRYR